MNRQLSEGMDRSFWSRKFVVTIISLGLITTITALTIPFPSLATHLATFIGGIIGSMSVYMGGNVANKFVVSKALPSTIVPTTQLPTIVEENNDNEEKEA